ncbi:ankyrin repeat domain-containing protein [Moraxella sp. ZY200743]|uniref:ankyrin repeat domain-containing protein n=1 Tax=Moraxella sp. ZY200743 TaxID=2911970 RepID=UPI003D7E14E3
MSGVEILRALRKGNIILLENLLKIYPQHNLLNINTDKKSWLHKVTDSLNANEPPPISIHYLLSLGIPINAQDIYGMTPLHYALRSQNADAAIALLEAGADPNIANIDGLRPLSMAGYTKDRLDVLKLMLDKGANVHHLMGDGSGRTILESRAPYKYTEDWVIEQWEIDFYEMMKQYS